MRRRFRLPYAERGANHADQDERSKNAGDRQQDVACQVPGTPALP
jgi:hypothetical protein